MFCQPTAIRLAGRAALLIGGLIAPAVQAALALPVPAAASDGRPVVGSLAGSALPASGGLSAAVSVSPPGRSVQLAQVTLLSAVDSLAVPVAAKSEFVQVEPEATAIRRLVRTPLIGGMTFAQVAGVGLLLFVLVAYSRRQHRRRVGWGYARGAMTRTGRN